MVSNSMRRLRPCLLLGVTLTWLLATQAQAQSPVTPRPDPLDPKAQVPLTRYQSAFAQFRRLGEDKPLGWREANDAVARIGGWRVYAREAQQSEPAAAGQPAVPGQGAATAPAASSAPAPVTVPTRPTPDAKPMPQGHSVHKH